MTHFHCLEGSLVGLWGDASSTILANDNLVVGKVRSKHQSIADNTNVTAISNESEFIIFLVFIVTVNTGK